jgi:hypothetical protein
MRCCACDDSMQRYFNCRLRIRGCVRRRGYRECGYMLLLLYFFIQPSVMCPGRQLGLPQPLCGDRAFAVFSLILRERGNYSLYGHVVFAVVYFSPLRFGFVPRLRALCKNRLRKTQLHTWTAARGQWSLLGTDHVVYVDRYIYCVIYA